MYFEVYTYNLSFCLVVLHLAVTGVYTCILTRAYGDGRGVYKGTRVYYYSILAGIILKDCYRTR